MAKELLSDGSDSSDVETGGAEIGQEFQVNEAYAQRFEHNKKREELQKLEEKFGSAASRKRKRGQDDDQSASDSESSSSEDEDEEGEFATAALDDEIQATLNAIRSKDPKVYDASATFYTELDDNALPEAKDKKDKPMFLRDYHRHNLLNGVRPDEEGEEESLSYNQQQENLKRSVISDFHAAAESSDDEPGEADGLLVRKNKEPETETATVKLDVTNADRDPETFLSNFMAARAWVPTDRSELHPFESDDEEEEKRADEFEEAYNMRFEDPGKSNEQLKSYARDMATQHSVRREEKNRRKKKREAEKAAQEAAKQDLREEKARLKKLKMEQVEDKVRRIKRAAGLKTNDLQLEEWAHWINDDWDDAAWAEEMQKRFGDQYYAEKDEVTEESEDGKEDSAAKRKKPKKPKFDDDIDITDIVPDFQHPDEEAANFSLSDDDQADQQIKRKSKKQERIDRQKDSKKERRIIEQLVEDQMQYDLNHALPASSRSKSAGFRYRETSPQSFGLTNRDILLADDSALNQFAGLKKLASWRDEEKKRKDRKHLGKKARLRQWRLDTFGDEEGLEGKDLAFTALMNGAGPTRQNGSDDEIGGVDIREGSKTKKGRRRKKVKANASTETRT